MEVVTVESSPEGPAGVSTIKRGGGRRVSVPYPTPSHRTKKHDRLTVEEEEL